MCHFNSLMGVRELKFDFQISGLLIVSGLLFDLYFPNLTILKSILCSCDLNSSVTSFEMFQTSKYKISENNSKSFYFGFDISGLLIVAFRIFSVLVSLCGKLLKISRTLLLQGEGL